MAANVDVGMLKVDVPNELVAGRNKDLIKKEIRRQIEEHIYCQNIAAEVEQEMRTELLDLFIGIESTRNETLSGIYNRKHERGLTGTESVTEEEKGELSNE